MKEESITSQKEGLGKRTRGNLKKKVASKYLERKTNIDIK